MQQLSIARARQVCRALAVDEKPWRYVNEENLAVDRAGTIYRFDPPSDHLGRHIAVREHAEAGLVIDVLAVSPTGVRRFEHLADALNFFFATAAVVAGVVALYRYNDDLEPVIILTLLDDPRVRWQGSCGVGFQLGKDLLAADKMGCAARDWLLDL